MPVPVTPSTRHFIKGNPMLRSYAAPGPAHSLPGDFVNRNLFMPFDQVYWKRDGEAARPPSKRPHSSGDPCDGQAWFGSCFYYGTAGEQVVADGGAGVVINFRNINLFKWTSSGTIRFCTVQGRKTMWMGNGQNRQAY